MFAKVHPAEDVKSGNTGSCHDLVRYLEKETGEGQRFFSHTEQDISPERVIMDIDGNKKALGANDAKFFMLSLNPSQSEQMHLIGRKVDDFKELTPQEKKEVFQKLEAFTRSAMDEYALNFGRDNIRGGQDLMYYARVETERSYHPEDEEVKQGIARIGEPKPGLNLHVHVIVSRKSLDGKVKLSPGAKSAGNTWELEGRGTVKRGFSHEGWKVRVQECFNRKFDYQAKEGETYVRPQVSAEIGKITNPELKRILQDEQFTAANQIVAAMREQGYTHQVRKGVHSFSREGEVFQVEHRLLKAFEQPLSDEQLKSITERFDLTKYEANPAGYRENGLQVKDISFSTYVKDEAQKGEKALKEVAYKVVYDEQNHTTVSFATVRQFAYEHQINLVKTNMLYDALLVPNIGVEFYVGKNWSLAGNWMYAWWKSDRHHNYWRLYGGDLEVRRWFGRKASEKPLAGHHIGLYGRIFTYDFETGGTGYMGGKPGGTLWDKMNYSVGLEYGYSLPVARRLNLDFVIGVGYWGGEYHKYAPIDGHYVWKETRRRHWFGLTEAEISLVWLLGRGNYNEKKGGRQ